MYRILLILYIIWGGVSIASGQDFNYSFTQLSTNQGLSQASVTSVTMAHPINQGENSLIL